MTAYLSVACLLIGLALYGFATNPKVNKIGEYMFWTGLLAFLLQNGSHLFQVGH